MRARGPARPVARLDDRPLHAALADPYPGAAGRHRRTTLARATSDLVTRSCCAPGAAARARVGAVWVSRDDGDRGRTTARSGSRREPAGTGGDLGSQRRDQWCLRRAPACSRHPAAAAALTSRRPGRGAARPRMPDAVRHVEAPAIRPAGPLRQPAVDIAVSDEFRGTSNHPRPASAAPLPTPGVLPPQARAAACRRGRVPSPGSATACAP